MKSHPCILLTIVLALVGCHDATTSSEQTIVLCDPSRCDGPCPFGMPNYLCGDVPDGSQGSQTIAGPVCIENEDGTCGWGLIDCPSDSLACSPDACGLSPGTPNHFCEDGSVAGPACLRDDQGTCGWQWLECAGDSPGGSGGACTWDDCPKPVPGMPNHLCRDGITVAGPACENTSNGTCAWAFHDCSP